MYKKNKNMNKFIEILRSAGPVLVMIVAGVFVFALQSICTKLKHTREQHEKILAKLDSIGAEVEQEIETLRELKSGISRLKKRRKG